MITAGTVPDAEADFPDNFKQSYLPQAFNDLEMSKAPAEENLLKQIDYVDSIKFQISKFSNDLRLIQSGSPIIAKTLENMDFLEGDIQALIRELSKVRSKVQNEQSELHLQINDLTERIELLKEEIEANVSQMDNLTETNRRITEINANNIPEDKESLEMQNLRFQINELNEKHFDQEQELKSLSRQLETREEVLKQRTKQMESLTNQVEDLSKKLENEIEKNTHLNLEDDEDPTSTKNQLIAKNKSLGEEVEKLKNELDSSQDYVSKLQKEISDLKAKLEEAGPAAPAEDPDDPFNLNMINMRNSEMLEAFKALNTPVEDNVPEGLEDATPEDKAQALQGEEPKERIVYREKIVEVPVKVEVEVEKIVEAEPKIIEKIVEKPVADPEIQAKHEAVINDYKGQVKDLQADLTRIKSEKSSKDLSLNTLQQKLTDLKKKLETETDLRTETEAKLAAALANQSQPEETPEIEESEKNTWPDNAKKEIALLKNKIEQLKLELEWFKKNSKKVEPGVEEKSETLVIQRQEVPAEGKEVVLNPVESSEPRAQPSEVIEPSRTAADPISVSQTDFTQKAPEKSVPVNPINQSQAEFTKTAGDKSVSVDPLQQSQAEFTVNKPKPVEETLIAEGVPVQPADGSAVQEKGEIKQGQTAVQVDPAEASKGVEAAQHNKAPVEINPDNTVSVDPIYQSQAEFTQKAGEKAVPINPIYQSQAEFTQKAGENTVSVDPIYQSQAEFTQKAGEKGVPINPIYESQAEYSQTSKSEPGTVSIDPARESISISNYTQNMSVPAEESFTNQVEAQAMAKVGEAQVEAQENHQEVAPLAMVAPSSSEFVKKGSIEAEIKLLNQMLNKERETLSSLKAETTFVEDKEKALRKEIDQAEESKAPKDKIESLENQLESLVTQRKGLKEKQKKSSDRVARLRANLSKLLERMEQKEKDKLESSRLSQSMVSNINSTPQPSKLVDSNPLTNSSNSQNTKQEPPKTNPPQKEVKKDAKTKKDAERDKKKKQMEEKMSKF